ncbi:MAG: carboxypeptidase regulatory-like domain-containing protein [bacterium]
MILSRARQALLVGMGVAAHAAAAQTDSTRLRVQPGIIDGLVADTALVPLEGATISILGSGLRVSTRENGRFRMLGMPQGEYVLLVRRLGYEGTTVKVLVEPEEVTRLSFALSPVVTKLAAMEISTRGVSQRMTEFYQRRDEGIGHFITREEIVKRNSVTTFDLLRSIPSIRVSDVDASGTARVASTRSNCTPQIMLNGLPITPAFVPSPNELAGIEVYSGPATMPLQFKRSGRTAGSSPSDGEPWCALILLWTGDGR